jgi:hypothetical protein
VTSTAAWYAANFGTYYSNESDLTIQDSPANVERFYGCNLDFLTALPYSVTATSGIDTTLGYTVGDSALNEEFYVDYVEDGTTCDKDDMTLAFTVNDLSITSSSEPIKLSNGILTMSSSDNLQAGIYTFDIQVDLLLDDSTTTESITYSITVTIVEGDGEEEDMSIDDSESEAAIEET